MTPASQQFSNDRPEPGNPAEDADLVRRLSLFASAGAAFAMAIGLSVLVGWTFDIPVLLNWGAPTATAPNGAGCFALAGLALWLLRRPDSQSAARLRLARLASAIVFFTGLLTLVEHLFSLDLGIDRLLLVAPALPRIGQARILMSPAAAGAFLLVSLALISIDARTRRGDWPAQFLVVGATILSLFGLFGLVLGPRVSAIALAAPAVPAFLAIVSGLLCSRATWALGGFLTRRSPGARLLRRVLPAALLVLSLLGWLISKPLLTPATFSWVQASTLALLTAVILAVFIGWIAYIVDRGDAERRKLEAALQASQEQLDRLLDRVAEPASEVWLRRRVKMVLAVAVILTGLLGILSWPMAEQAAEDADAVVATREVSETLLSTIRHLLDVETGARGFALTGHDPFLEPYESGRLAAQANLEALQLLMTDPERRQQLDLLRGQAEGALAAAAELVSERQNSGEIPTLVQLERGKRLMDSVRATVERLEAAQKRLLEQRAERAIRARQSTGVVIALSSLLGVAFLSIAGVILLREIGTSARARAQVQALNADLEQRVRRRTAALESEAASRLAVEARLRASEDLFRTLLDGIRDYAVYMVDSEGRVATWNAGAARIKGYTSAEIMGQPVSVFYTEADRESGHPAHTLREALRTGRFEEEGWRRRKDGSLFWADVVITPLYEVSGELRGYSKVVRDITDRRRAAQELKKQAALLDLAHDAILVRDLEGRLLLWNRGAEQLYGWRAEEVRGRVAWDLLKSRYPVPLPVIEAALATTSDWEGEVHHTTRDGVEVIVASRWCLQRDDRTGEPAAILEINRDITDRKRAEEALGESEGRLAGIIDSAMDAIITVDDEQRILLFNGAAEKMFVCPATEAIGQPITAFIPEHFDAVHRRHSEPFGAAGAPRGIGSKEMLRGLRRDGREFPMEASLSQVFAGGKRLFTVILRDISERVEAEKAIREAHARMTCIVSSAMDAIITVDRRRQRIAVFNAAAARTFRCPEQDALGESIKRFIPRRFRSAYFARIRQFEQSGETNLELGRQPGGLWAQRADGEEFQIEASISQVEIDGEKLFTVILRDVTERRQAEEVRERLAAVVDSSDDAIIGKTLDGTINAWNRSAEKLFGYSASEAIGMPMSMLMPPGRVDEEAELLARIRRGEGVEHFETTRIRKDGRSIEVSATISPVRDSTGAIIGASKIARDITERKFKEEALRESQERFRLFIEHAPASLAMFDRNMRYLHLSRRWRLDFGLGLGDLAGVSHYELFPEMPEAWKEVHRRAMKGEVLRSDCDRFDRADGRTQWIKWEVRPWEARTGEIGGILVFTEDITERYRAEQALREQEHLLSESQRITHLGSWTFDLTKPDGRLLWSEETYRIYGVEPESFTPSVMALLNLIVAEDQPAMKHWIEECAAGREPADLRFRARHPDGTIRILNGRGELLLDPANRPVQMIGTLQDVTERLAAEAALRESEDRFEAMANGIPQLAWMAEADGSIFWYNRRWYEYTGTTFEQMQGWGWQRVHDPAALPGVLERWRGAIASGQPFDMEFPLRGADGQFRTFLTRVMPVKDPAGRVVRWLGTNTDISERKQTEERLAAQAAELAGQAVELMKSRGELETQKLMLQSVVDSIVEGLVATDERGEFILWNPAAERILGLGAVNLSPADWSAHYGAFLPDTVTPLPADRHPLVGAIRGQVNTAEIYFHNPSLGRGVFVECHGAPLRDQNGRIRGGVVAFRDITQKKADDRQIRQLNDELEARIAERTAQLETTNRELEAFTYSVSHDLRAPIRHISGFARVLSEDFGALLPADARRHLQRIEDGSRRMSCLVDDLLGLARLGKQALTLRMTALHPLVEEVVALLAPECAGRQVEWRIAPLPALNCDPGLMGQVFQNLLGNSLKYSRGRECARIEIDAIEEAGKPVVIRVRDNGAGFDMKYASRLFGVFQRLHRAEEFEGTGVGLATTQRIIQKHGGTIWAESEPDRGATFYFTVGGCDAAKEGTP